MQDYKLKNYRLAKPNCSTIARRKFVRFHKLEGIESIWETSQWQAATRVRTRPPLRNQRRGPIEVTFVARMNSFVMILSRHSSRPAFAPMEPSLPRVTPMEPVFFLHLGTRWGAAMKKKRDEKEKKESKLISAPSSGKHLSIECLALCIHFTDFSQWRETNDFVWSNFPQWYELVTRARIERWNKRKTEEYLSFVRNL